MARTSTIHCLHFGKFEYVSLSCELSYSILGGGVFIARFTIIAIMHEVVTITSKLCIQLLLLNSVSLLLLIIIAKKYYCYY